VAGSSSSGIPQWIGLNKSWQKRWWDGHFLLIWLAITDILCPTSVEWKKANKLFPICIRMVKSVLCEGASRCLTPLHIASQNGHLEFVRLWSLGAEYWLKLFIWLVKNGHFKIAKYLMEKMQKNGKRQWNSSSPCM